MPLPLDELVAHPQLVNERAQELDWEELLFEYERVLDDMQAWLRGLNEAQIHFKPEPKVFSIAEIVTHTAFADEMFWTWLKLLAQGRSTEIDPQTLVSGDGARKDVTLSDLAGLNEACRTLARATIDTLPERPNLEQMAPHPYFGLLNARGWIYFMCLHRGLHRYQCERVIDAPGFPRSTSVQTQQREAYQPSERKTWLSEDGKGQDARSKKQAARGKKQKTKGKGHRTKSPATKKQPARKKTATRSK